MLKMCLLTIFILIGALTKDIPWTLLGPGLRLAQGFLFFFQLSVYRLIVGYFEGNYMAHATTGKGRSTHGSNGDG